MLVQRKDAGPIAQVEEHAFKRTIFETLEKLDGEYPAQHPNDGKPATSHDATSEATDENDRLVKFPEEELDLRIYIAGDIDFVHFFPSAMNS
jgi:hypothetical protein